MFTHLFSDYMLWGYFKQEWKNNCDHWHFIQFQIAASAVLIQQVPFSFSRYRSLAYILMSRYLLFKFALPFSVARTYKRLIQHYWGFPRLSRYSEACLCTFYPCAHSVDASFTRCRLNRTLNTYRETRPPSWENGTWQVPSPLPHSDCWSSLVVQCIECWIADNRSGVGSNPNGDFCNVWYQKSLRQLRSDCAAMFLLVFGFSRKPPLLLLNSDPGIIGTKYHVYIYVQYMSIFIYNNIHYIFQMKVYSCRWLLIVSCCVVFSCIWIYVRYVFSLCTKLVWLSAINQYMSYDVWSLTAKRGVWFSILMTLCPFVVSDFCIHQEFLVKICGKQNSSLFLLKIVWFWMFAFAFCIVFMRVATVAVIPWLVWNSLGEFANPK